MKTKLFLLVLLLQMTPFLGFSQRTYVDISDCESTNNDKIKLGWGSGDPAFSDEFNFPNPTTGNPLQIDYLSTLDPDCVPPWNPYCDLYKVVKSDENWRWRNDPNTFSGDEVHYYALENIVADAVSDYVTLKITNPADAFTMVDAVIASRRGVHLS